MAREFGFVTKTNPTQTQIFTLLTHEKPITRHVHRRLCGPFAEGGVGDSMGAPSFGYSRRVGDGFSQTTGHDFRARALHSRYPGSCSRQRVDRQTGTQLGVEVRASCGHEAAGFADGA